MIRFLRWLLSLFCATPDVQPPPVAAPPPPVITPPVITPPVITPPVPPTPEPPPPAPPSPPDPRMQFVDQGVVMEAGPPGSLDVRLHGMISPCRVWADGNDVLQMTYVGADGDRPDGGPAHRRLLLADSHDGGASWEEQGLDKEWSPQGNAEEGVFSATEHHFSAVSAANPTTESVWSDVRTLENDQLVLDHADASVWGHGDEVFVHSESTEGLLYIAKAPGINWGLGERLMDGSTFEVINPQHDYQRVVGGGSCGRYVVLVRGFREGGSTIEWYAQDDLTTPIYRSRFGARHVTPYWDGETWWLYGRVPAGNAIRRWRLETVAPAAPDEIDTTQINWLHADIGQWRITSKITHITLKPDMGLGVYHTGAGTWPEYIDGGTRGEGNIWIFGKIDGQWRGATCEWLRIGQQYKPGLSRENIGAHTKTEPLKSWVPAHGETVGFCMSTPARSPINDLRTSNERSNISLVVWP
jgi:hypothetical protein